MTKRPNAKKRTGSTTTRKTARRAASGTSKAKKAAGKKPAAKKCASGSARGGQRPKATSTRGEASGGKTRPTVKSAKTTGAKKTAKKKAVPRKVTVKKSHGAPGPNKRGSTATATVPALPTEPPVPKTRLSDADLAEFKALLLRKRAELTGDVQDLARHALDHKTHGGLEHSAMPIHMADLGSDNWEKEFTLGLIANEQSVVREIDEALERINNRTYGVCLATHKRITKARLRAKPWAKYCIQYALAREEGRAF